MTNLKNSILFCAFIFNTISCVSSFYKNDKQQGMKAELSASPDRIVATCEKVSDENDHYMFQIFILNEKRTFLTAVQGNNTDYKGCEEWKDSVNKVLKTGHKIYLGVMGYPDKSDKTDDETVYFPNHGIVVNSGRVVQFIVIANENGICHDAYHGNSKPCPGRDFPIK